MQALTEYANQYRPLQVSLYVPLVAELPKGATGKVLEHELRRG
ncbi:hypothetical protein Rwratislav_31204 [Rhodococcus wratislaviensis IFP 2016]|nr:hypothetical protein [Rhodococcus koreensis]ELB89083.1 hypothetical protein Rwratislav_31204 [Rhodococcus wratislaviensis IFP 2016]